MELADRIVTGEIHPGEKLEEQAIADAFRVSRTPVREALRELAATGLVEVRPHKGAFVADIGIDQLKDMFETMGELEALCTRLSAQRMDAVERKSLELIHADSRKMVEDDDDKAYSITNERFHDTICRGAHNESLREITANFRRRLAPFRAKIFFTTGNRMRFSLDEHEEILAAIRTGDADRAYGAMQDHVAGSSLNVIEYLSRARAQSDAPTQEARQRFEVE